jgi:hypothetical protein
VDSWLEDSLPSVGLSLGFHFWICLSFFVEALDFVFVFVAVLAFWDFNME